MANETTNLKLTKPLANEFYDINVFNDNFDKIDKELFDPSVTENTSYATENGVKEFECKNGYVDNIVIEGQTKILNAENIEVEAGTDGAKLVSVGQGDKIEVLTRGDEGNLFNNEYRNGSYLDDGSFYSGNNGTSNTELLYVKPNTKYSISYDNSNASAIFEFDVNKRFIKRTSSSNSFSFTTTSNTRYINFFIGTNSQGFNPLIKTIISEGDIAPYQPSQQDKKQILTTLRSLPNGVKDTIEKRGNKYVKVQRCTEFSYSGEDFQWLDSTGGGTTVQANISVSNCKDAYVLSNLASYRGSVPTTEPNTETVFYSTVENVVCIRLSSTKFTTDKDQVKQYLLENNFKAVLELATPIITELPNFNPQTFEGDTTLLINSGVIQAEADFEVTNSMGSEIEVLKGKVSSLDDFSSNYNYKNIASEITFLNGWNRWGNDLRFNAFVVDNIVKICILLEPGVKNHYTPVFTMPKEYAPETKEFIACADPNQVIYTGCLDEAGMFQFDNNISELSFWICINLTYPLRKKVF